METFTANNKNKVVINMQGLIISNGHIGDYKKLNRIFQVSDFVICADGGIRHLIKIHAKPNIIIGDFDSTSKEDLAYIKENNIKIEKYPPVKDKTDTEIAMDYLVGMGCREIYFMGATGSRQDHSIANIFLLDYLLKKNIKGTIFDDNNTIYMVDDKLTLEKQESTYVSIIPISDKGINLSISGFFYDLDHVFIPFASSHGVSNEIVDDNGIIQIHRGKALVIQSFD